MKKGFHLGEQASAEGMKSAERSEATNSPPQRSGGGLLAQKGRPFRGAL